MSAAHLTLEDFIWVTWDSYPVEVTPLAARGLIIQMRQSGRLVMHSLDKIALEHVGDYDGHMAAVMRWVLDRAGQAFDRLVSELDAAMEAAR